MKRLSVVITVYNTEKYLRQCLDSIVNQDYEKLEIVIVDDGSTDGSGKICDLYSRKYNNVIVIHQENKGKTFSRYIGAKSSSGDYITYVDSDDWLMKGIYNNLSCFLDMDIDVISFSIIRFFTNEKKIYDSEMFHEGVYDKEDIEKYVFPEMIWTNKNRMGVDPAVWNKLFKREKILYYSEKAKDLNILYGDDCAIVYPLISSVDSLAFSKIYGYYHRQRLGRDVSIYYENPFFYKEVYILYDYLKNELDGNSSFLRQLDFWYANEMQNCLLKYGKKLRHKYYLFPFDKVKKNDNVVLYGAGEVGSDYYRQITALNYSNICGWVDKYYHKYSDNRVKNIDYIKTLDYDWVIVSIANESIVNDVINDLIEMGVEKSKIIWSGETCISI